VNRIAYIDQRETIRAFQTPPPLLEVVCQSDSGAIFGGRDDEYRYVLWRWLVSRQPLFWEANHLAPTAVLFSMLNPSTADEKEPDQTLSSCKGLAKKWGGFELLLLGNLYGYRTPSPRVLRDYDGDPIGPENDMWLGEMAKLASRIVFAPGADRMVKHNGRNEAVLRLLRDNASHRTDIVALGPKARHPLYCPHDIEIRRIDAA